MSRLSNNHSLLYLIELSALHEWIDRISWPIVVSCVEYHSSVIRMNHVRTSGQIGVEIV